MSNQFREVFQRMAKQAQTAASSGGGGGGAGGGTGGNGGGAQRAAAAAVRSIFALGGATAMGYGAYYSFYNVFHFIVG